MGLLTDKENKLREFLLGTLPAAEREAIEEKFMADEELFAALNLAEEDLLEEYARGELSEAERQQLERHLLRVPRNLERARFLRTMQAAFERGQQMPSVAAVERQAIRRGFFQSPFWRYALVATCLVLAGAFVWWVLMRGRTSEAPLLANQATPLPPANTAPQATNTPNPATLNENKSATNSNSAINNNAAPPPDSSPRDKPAPRPRPAAQPFVATLLLTPGATRSEGPMPELIVPARAQGAQIKLVLEMDVYPNYRAVLSDENGAPVWASGILKARGQTVTLNIPRRFLLQGDYFIKLSGVSGTSSIPAADYSLRISTP